MTITIMISFGDGWSEGSKIRIMKGDTLYVESRMEVGFEIILQWERDCLQLLSSFLFLHSLDWKISVDLSSGLPIISCLLKYVIESF